MGLIRLFSKVALIVVLISRCLCIWMSTKKKCSSVSLGLILQYESGCLVVVEQVVVCVKSLCIW